MQNLNSGSCLCKKKIILKILRMIWSLSLNWMDKKICYRKWNQSHETLQKSSCSVHCGIISTFIPQRIPYVNIMLISKVLIFSPIRRKKLSKMSNFKPRWIPLIDSHTRWKFSLKIWLIGLNVKWRFFWCNVLSLW